MESFQVQSNQRSRVIWLGTSLGLAMLSLAALLWFGANTNLATASPVSNEGTELRGDSSVITVGVAIPLTLIPDLSWQQVNAVQLAISQTNAAGGIEIGGTSYSVMLAMADSGCNATQAVTAANELLAKGAVAVVGHTCSVASEAAAPVYNAAGVAMVTPVSTALRVTQQGYTTTFRVTPHDGAEAIELASCFSSIGLKRTAILLRGLPYVYSPMIGSIYQDTYTGMGGTVVSSRTITVTADITPALVAVQSENIDVLFIADLTGDLAGEISRVAHSMGLTPAVAWPSILDDYISTYAGEQAAEGDYGALKGRRTSDMPGYAAFERDYVAASFPNAPTPGFFSPASYDATNIIIDAIERANTTDTLAIRAAIAATVNYAGVVGVYQGFDANRDIVPQWAHVGVVNNGEWVPVWVQAEIYPDQGGILDLESTLGQTTTIEIPAGATTEILAITYTQLATVTDAGVPTMTMIGHAMRLESNVFVSSPMTMTIEYEDEDMAGVDASTLLLYTWNGSQWMDAAPCGGYIRDLDNTILKIIICHFADYVLLGESEYKVYLPLTLK
jgi:branched-chain amino acid transport system substrate-binding protein